MLRFPIPDKPRKLKGVIIGCGSGPKERIIYLQKMVTMLFRHERIEGREDRMEETRQYAEQLINVAMAHGDRHEKTMDLAKQWLWDGDLIHKLFKVYVPRYVNYDSAFTNIYRLPATYPGNARYNAVLEFKGNPYPPVLPHKRQTEGIITNVLFQAAKTRNEHDPVFGLVQGGHGKMHGQVSPQSGRQSPKHGQKSSGKGQQSAQSLESHKVPEAESQNENETSPPAAEVEIKTSENEASPTSKTTSAT